MEKNNLTVKLYLQLKLTGNRKQKKQVDKYLYTCFFFNFLIPGQNSILVLILAVGAVWRGKQEDKQMNVDRLFDGCEWRVSRTTGSIYSSRKATKDPE